MGTGGRAQYLLSVAAKAENTQIASLCDVYETRREEARGKVGTADTRLFLDHRELLAQKDIDAVIIGSPDHWHVPMTLDAIRAGKDVYVEKPVSHTIEEGEELLRVSATLPRIIQVGYQQRSWEHFIQGRELVAAGKLGKITLVLASWYQAYWRTSRGTPPVETAKLDWKRFLGSAPDQPFEARRFRYWRWFWDFGGGHLTDLYSHYGDVIHWYMASDTPLEAQAMGSSLALTDFECPDTMSANYRYPGFYITYTGTLNGSLDGGNILFRGSDAMMKINRDGLAIYAEGVVPSERTNYPEPLVQVPSAGDGTIPHMRNFLECVRSRRTPNAPPSVAVPAARAAHLGNLALRGGKTVKWPM
jgi:predicted dehydrogenase